MIILEACTDSVESALIAESVGASRIEFCDNLGEGGTTPSIAQIKIARKLLNIPLYVLIRSRGGDFFYSDIEFETMKLDIRECGEAGCKGVVIGMLHADGSIDIERCRELMKVAKEYSMGVTFHRAIDHCSNMFQALEDIIQLGCERILTSGGKLTALEGADTICRLIEKAKKRIIIMPGSGVTPENIAELVKKTGASEVHGTFRSLFHGKTNYVNTEFPDSERSRFVVDPDKLEKAMYAINNL